MSLKYSADQYGSYVFDCDGVLLDSNKVKTEAFYFAVLPYGEDKANAFVEYHKNNGGISRQEKFKWFFLECLGRNELPEDLYGIALEDYAVGVKKGLESCRVPPGVVEFLDHIPLSSKKFVVSGGAQDEVRWALGLKGLDEYFEGIYGNPRDKVDIVGELIKESQLKAPVLYIGDARYDHHVACHYGFDFLFLSGLTEFEGWKEYCQDTGIMVAGFLNEIL